MEIRRLGKAVLRSQTLSRIYLYPSTRFRCLSIAQRAPIPPPRRHLKSSFTLSARSAAKPAQITTSASSRAEKTGAQSDWRFGATSRLSSRSPFPQTQGDERAPLYNTTETERLMNGGDSATVLLAGLRKMEVAGEYGGLDVNRMADKNVPGNDRFELGALRSDVHKGAPPPRPPMRLTPVTGRTVHVTSNSSVEKAFGMMDKLVLRNKIRSTFSRQRFHERPGLKRKRMKSMLWRKKFMAGFRATVHRVQQLKAQGW